MTIRILKIFIFLIVLNQNCFSQDKYEVVKNITYSTTDNFEKLERTGLKIKEFKNSIITLSETFSGKGIISRHDLNGNVIWEKNFNNERINDIQVYNNFIYATGYKYLKRKAWVSKIDSLGNIIWEKLIRFQYENEAESISISQSGEIYILCEIQKAQFPIKLRLKRNGYKHITFVPLKKDIMENQIGIAKIDTSGKLKWKRKFGKQKNYNSYFAGTIKSTNADILSSFYFREIKNNVENEGTRLIKLNRNGKILNKINTKNRLFDKIIYQDSNFFFIGNSINKKVNMNDTITISRLFQNKLIPENKYISDFDTFNITAQITDSLGNIYWGGYVSNFESLGSLWSNHNDIYIAKLDERFNLIWDYKFNQESIDKINDMVLIENKVYAIGESWFENNGQIDKRMRLIIIKQK